MSLQLLRRLGFRDSTQQQVIHADASERWPTHNIKFLAVSPFVQLKPVALDAFATPIGAVLPVEEKAGNAVGQTQSQCDG